MTGKDALTLVFERLATAQEGESPERLAEATWPAFVEAVAEATEEDRRADALVARWRDGLRRVGQP